ncbi:MAG: Ig-like domain-containing protein, partial [Myxococcaceae bacterium]|nr:Ig-like domain-containing protein [Myxococcaceae bacterium]
MRWLWALVVVSLVACGPTPPAGDAGVGGGAGGGDTGGGGTGGGATDTVKPQVVSTMPAAQASNVATGASVQLVFSEAMNPASVTVSASPGITFGAPVWSAANAAVTLTPASALTASTSYTLTVNGADVAGNALSPAFTFSFTTAPAADTTPPTVTTTLPAGGATGVATSTPLSVSFSEAMNPATVTLVVSPSVALSPLSWTSASELTVSPVAALGFSTTYTVTVGGADVAGNALAAPFTFSFTTGVAPDTTPPTLQSSTPAGGAMGVPAATRLSLTFSEPMSPATVSVDVNPNLELGAEAWGNENRTITFSSPVDDWAYSTTYTVTVTGSDVAGNPMTETTVTFTTETPPDTTRPTVVSAAPGAGALNVPVNTNLEFIFSEP